MTDPHGNLELIDLEAGAPSADQDATRLPRGQRRDPDARTTFPRWAWLLLAVVVLLGLWGVMAYRHLTAIRDDLVDSRQLLDSAMDAVAAGELRQADEALEDTHERLEGTPGRLRSPLIAPARLLPGFGRTLDAVHDLAAAAEMITAAGIGVVEVLGADGEGLGALTPTDGRLPVEAFERLAPALTQAETAIVTARSLVVGVPRAGIDAEVLEARDTFLALIDPVADQVADVARLAEVLPDLFGADGARQYMVVASNPTEARGTGGFWGAFTILEVVDGELSFSEVLATQDHLPLIPRDEIPWPDPSLGARYDAYGGSGFPVNLNMTPDFPSAATAMERYYRAATGIELDGVISVDPFAFEALLRITGPVEVPGFGSVGPDEVVEFVSHDAYAEIIDPDERKRLIGLVATAALQGFLDTPPQVSTGEVLTTLAGMVGRESILVHAADPEIQEAIVALGLAGPLGPGGEGDFLAVHLNSGANYKVDYWLERYLRYDVVLSPGGVAVGTLSTGFTNGAPVIGEPAYMIGFGRGDPLDLADVLSYVSVYCAPGCALHEVPDSGFADLETERGEELGFGVTSTWMRLPAGQSRELVWSYSTPHAWEAHGVDRVYRLHYGHQTTIIPTQLDLRVAIPEGFEPTRVPDGAEVVDGAVVLQVAASTDLDLEVVFSPAS